MSAPESDIPDLPGPGPITRYFILPVLKGLPPIRALQVIHRRGYRCFTLRMGTGLIIGPNDYGKVSEVLLAMYENFGYGRNPRSGFSTMDLGQSDTDQWHNRHLIVAGGPDQNAITDHLVHNREFLHHIAFYPGVGPSTMTRAFMWRNRLYTGNATQDYGLIAVRPHPYNPAKRIALMFGFGAMGTLGAVRVFGDPAYADLRKFLTDSYGCVDGSLEALVSVAHTGDRISRISAVESHEGMLLGGDHRQRLHPYEEPLNKLWNSLQQYPPAVLIPEIDHSWTISDGFAVRYDTTATWERFEDDVLIRGQIYSGDRELADWTELGFHAQIEGGDTEVIYLPAVNEPTRKTFVLFPVPPLRGAGKRIRVRTVATWPATLERLRRPNGRDRLSIGPPQGLAGKVGKMRLRIQFDTPGMKYEINENFSHDRHRSRKVTVHGTDSHEVVLTDVPAGKKIVFEFRRLS